MPPPSGNASATTHRTSTVDITSSPCSIWLVTWLFRVDYLHMETGPLVWWKSFFVTTYRRSYKGLAPTKHFISGQPHFGHNCFWGWGVTVWGCFSFYSKMDLYVLDGNLTGQKYHDNVLAPRVVPYFDNHMRWLTSQCSWTTTLGHIEPEFYNIFYSKRPFRQFHGLRCRQTWTL